MQNQQRGPHSVSSFPSWTYYCSLLLGSYMELSMSTLPVSELEPEEADFETADQSDPGEGNLLCHVSIPASGYTACSDSESLNIPLTGEPVSDDDIPMERTQCIQFTRRRYCVGKPSIQPAQCLPAGCNLPASHHCH